MQKVQCLTLAKGFLAGSFMGAMTHLAQGHHWRSRFEDQLQMNYKEWLFRKVSDEFTKAVKVEDFVGGREGILGDQLAAIEKTKEPIKKQILAHIAKKDKIR